jgi:tripartite-type tricarboxylate transporter receptor subunit TctC
MKLPRRNFLHLAAGAAALPTVTRIAWAQAYPTRPVRVIVPFAPGGNSDITARLLGQWLSERLGQQFVIDNRPGGGGNIGTEAVVRSSPDGYTLLLVGGWNAINATFYDKLSFNFIRDIAPVASIIVVPNVMVVNPSVPAKTVPEFIAYAKTTPGQNQLCVGWNRSTVPCAEQIGERRPATTIGHVGHIDAGHHLEQLAGHRLRALAVTTATRLEVLPDVPTVGEFVPGYEASSWNGIGAPKGTPVEIIDKLNKEINAALGDPKMKARLADLGGTPLLGSPADFGKLIADETEKWAKVVKLSGAKAD